jgi:hypothetical protein
MVYYGYNFTNINSGGLGAIIHSVLLAKKYANENHLDLVFEEEGYDIPRLNGSVNDHPSIETKTWHSYFKSFDIMKQSECNGSWPIYLPDTTDNKADRTVYKNILQKEIWQMHDHIANEIDALVCKTPFEPSTDAVLHVRRTDKVTENPEIVPLEVIIRDCERVIDREPDIKRLYICTDDPSICVEIREHFAKKQFPVVWDTTETEEPLQLLRWSGKLDKLTAQEETMNAFKNIFIMRDAKYLIGGRMSYFFRIGELLRDDDNVVNTQDNDTFGIAPYIKETYLVRPHKPKRFTNFVNKQLNLLSYQKEYIENPHVIIHDFIDKNVANILENALSKYKWWSYSMLPTQMYGWKKPLITTDADTFNNEKGLCENSLDAGHFAYRFSRQYGIHFKTCECVTCCLYDTLSSWPFISLLETLTGKYKLVAGEIIISRFEKGDFLSVHHDIGKGDIALTLSFTKDWNPSYGGILHFCDKDGNIHKSNVPQLGTACIFDVIDGKTDHFVSHVAANKDRFMVTAWYSSIL